MCCFPLNSRVGTAISKKCIIERQNRRLDTTCARCMSSMQGRHNNRPHTTLTKRAGGYKTTPAMAAGLAERVNDVRWLSDMVNEYMPKPGKRGTYKPRANS